jgi:hypothetical protein
MVQSEVGGHSPLLLDATAEWHTDEVAPQIVRPLVVRAHELGGMTEVRLAELYTAMRAAILNHVEASSFVKHYDDRLIADNRTLEVARCRDLRFKRDIGPGAPAEYALLLARIDLRVDIDPVWNAGNTFFGPLVTHNHWLPSCF